MSQQPGVQNIKRIVVRGTNWVGDAMITVPALRELRLLFPNAHITLATRPWAKGLFTEVDFVDDLQVEDERGLGGFIKQVRAWRKGRFDLAVLLTNSFASALVAALAGVPIRIGYATDRRARLLTHPVEVPDWRSSKHEVFYYLKIVAELEWLFTQQQTFLEREPNASIEVSPVRQGDAHKLLISNGVNPNLPVVAICPGSINSRAKRWLPESYATLADRCID